MFVTVRGYHSVYRLHEVFPADLSFSPKIKMHRRTTLEQSKDTEHVARDFFSRSADHSGADNVIPLVPSLVCKCCRMHGAMEPWQPWMNSDDESE